MIYTPEQITTLAYDIIAKEEWTKEELLKAKEQLIDAVNSYESYAGHLLDAVEMLLGEEMTEKVGALADRMFDETIQNHKEYETMFSEEERIELDTHVRAVLDSLERD